MLDALRVAKKARERGEVPVGAVVYHGDKRIAEGFNLRESAQDPTAHAELIAVRAAAARLRSFRLEGCDVYVTLEPCPMCAGMLVAARVRRVIYAASDPKVGAIESVLNLAQDDRLNHRFEVTRGVCEVEARELLTSFFREVRARRKR